MPGQGRAIEREFSPEERAALRNALPALGERTVDVYLNGEAFGATFPPPYGPTGSGAIRCSRNGCPTASAPFWAASSGPMKWSTFAMSQGGSARSSCSRGQPLGILHGLIGS